MTANLQNNSQKERNMILVSKCLTGVPCRMDGQSKLVPEIRKLVDEGKAVPVCPEVLGGLPTPRKPSERLPDGRAVNCDGEDNTDAFNKGAEMALRICREHGCTQAILKSKSPSCGKGIIHNGKFDGGLVEGNGVFAELLLSEGITVMTEEEYLNSLTSPE